MTPWKLLNNCGTVFQVFVLSLLICCLQLHLDFWSVSGQILVRNRWWVFQGRELEAIIYILDVQIQESEEDIHSDRTSTVSFLYKTNMTSEDILLSGEYTSYTEIMISVGSISGTTTIFSKVHSSCLWCRTCLLSIWKKDLKFSHFTVSIDTVYCIIWFMRKLIFCFIFNM